MEILTGALLAIIVALLFHIHSIRKKIGAQSESQRLAELELIQAKSDFERTLSVEKEGRLLLLDEEISKRKEARINELNHLLQLEEFKISNRLSEYSKGVAAEIEEIDTEIELLKAELDSWRKKHQSVIETYERLEQIRTAESFHKLSFSTGEVEEIMELNKIIPKLTNPTALRKAIYDIYYKNKVSDLIIRIVGKERVSGIYKITHFPSGKSYVGQSVDIAERWKSHCKRGAGADQLTNNKLYPAMLEHGLWEFSFEILETTEDAKKLTEMEKYWQEFYESKKFGYSMR